MTLAQRSMLLLLASATISCQVAPLPSFSFTGAKLLLRIAHALMAAYKQKIKLRAWIISKVKNKNSYCTVHLGSNTSSCSDTIWISYIHCRLDFD